MRLDEQKVTIVGLGLMGGSLALALRGRTAQLTAVDTHSATRQMAIRHQIVDRVYDRLALGVAGADLVVLATPVQRILTLLAELPTHRPGGCLVLDLGSTKAQIGRAMAALPDAFAAIGGHPLCGREMAGLPAAQRDLFRGQTFVLCRNARTTPRAEAAALALVEAVGARPLFMDAAQHDSVVGVTSHLPYLLAAALVQVAANGAEPVWPLTASGFRDASRLAGSDPAMMLDILLTNMPAVRGHLDALLAALTAVAAHLDDPDSTGLAGWLADAQRHYEDYQQARAAPGAE